MQVVPASEFLVSHAPAPVDGEADNTVEAMVIEGERHSGEGLRLGQSRVLYTEHGQQNPASAKAAKKRARKFMVRADIQDQPQ